MIAHISPAEQDWHETLNTLRYANRVKFITNCATVQERERSSSGQFDRAGDCRLPLDPPSAIERTPCVNATSQLEQETSIFEIRELRLSEIPLSPHRPRAFYQPQQRPQPLRHW